MPDVVITGVGAVTPLGVGARTLHARWTAGSSGIAGGEAPCADFDPLSVLSRKEARRADRFSQLAIAASEEALADAGWVDGIPYDGHRVGCVLGTGIGGLSTLEAGQTDLLQKGAAGVSPLSVPLMMGNAGAASLAMRHGLQGPCFGIVSACAAGANAIGDAMRMIMVGDADAVVTGGAEATLTPLSRACFSSLGAISVSGESRPFDARRDGFVMGEGAGVLVLENGDMARARGARIIGVVRGYGASCDAFHLTAPATDGEGAARAISAALRDAGIVPEDLDYVNAHGTSTPLNDRAETLALKSALGAYATQVPTSSTKSAIGHLLGAAGAVEAIATVLALRDRVAPPTLGYEEVEEGMDLDYVPLRARPLQTDGDGPVLALSNSFGFGGHNAALVLEAA